MTVVLLASIVPGRAGDHPANIYPVFVGDVGGVIVEL